MILIIGICQIEAKPKKGERNLFKDGFSVQSTAKTPLVNETKISAKIDGKWQSYDLVTFPDAFWNWNTSGRKLYIDIFREMLEKGPESTRKPELSGPHNGIVATYGSPRKDSRFAINNAVKGMGLLPKAEKLDELIALLRETKAATLDIRLNVLDSLYSNAREIFAPDRLVSLELYSEQGFQTQTFINQMQNPAVAIVWMDIPTFKMKGIARLLHPDDPNLSDYEKKCVEYINLIHSYFHGEFPRDYIGVIYFATEIYDSSPGRKDAKGTRIK